MKDLKKKRDFFQKTLSIVDKFSLPFYMDDSTILVNEDFAEFWLEDYKYTQNSNSNFLKKIRFYYFTLFPDLRYAIFDNEHDFSSAFQTAIFETDERNGDAPQNLKKTLDEDVQNVDPKDLVALTHKAESYIDLDQYDTGLNILKDALKQVGNASYRFQILLKLAEGILESEDPSQFDEAEKYLQEILDKGLQGAENLDVSFTFTVGEGEKSQQIKKEDEIEKSKVLELMAVLHLYKGDFKQAYSLLKDIGKNERFFLSTGIFLKALKPQFKKHDFPHKLRNKINKLMSKTFGLILTVSTDQEWKTNKGNTKDFQELITKYGDVLDFLQKGHYFDKKKLEKLKKLAELKEEKSEKKKESPKKEE